MSTIYIILILVLIIIILGVVIYALIRNRKVLKKEISNLSNNLASAKVNVEQLADYIESIQKIKSDEKKI